MFENIYKTLSYPLLISGNTELTLFDFTANNMDNFVKKNNENGYCDIIHDLQKNYFKNIVLFSDDLAHFIVSLFDSLRDIAPFTILVGSHEIKDILCWNIKFKKVNSFMLIHFCYFILFMLIHLC